jgi:hypothetical protein
MLNIMSREPAPTQSSEESQNIVTVVTRDLEPAQNSEESQEMPELSSGSQNLLRVLRRAKTCSAL